MRPITLALSVAAGVVLAMALLVVGPSLLQGLAWGIDDATTLEPYLIPVIIIGAPVAWYVLRRRR